MGERELRVLVVDDEPAAVDSLVTLLSSEGHNCTGATSASEALRQCMKERFDCLVLDAQLGASSGLALAERIAGSSMRPRHILVLSAHPRIDFEAPLRNGLIDSYLQKPANNADLAEHVGHCIEKRRSMW